MTRAKHCLLLLVAGLLACSDPAPPVADAAPDGPVADATPPDATPPDTGPPVPCSEQIVGKPCTKDGKECGAGHTCLLASATAGFCSCACTPDDLSTADAEDTCPGTDLLCALYGPTDGVGQGYCFRTLGNTAPGCAANYTHNWDTPYAFAYANMELARLSPTSGPFTVLGVRYLLGGTGTSSSIPCDSTVPHRADIWVDTTTTPSSSPTVAVSFDVAPTTQGKAVAMALALETSIRLESGDHLFVAVELSNKVDGKAMCIANCTAGTAGASSYTSWTGASILNNAPPYSWSSYQAMGTPRDLATLALGFDG